MGAAKRGEVALGTLEVGLGTLEVDPGVVGSVEAVEEQLAGMSAERHGAAGVRVRPANDRRPSVVVDQGDTDRRAAEQQPTPGRHGLPQRLLVVRLDLPRRRPPGLSSQDVLVVDEVLGDVRGLLDGAP